MVEDNIIITCVTTNSAIQAWSSEEYIGQGGIQLEFLTVDEIGRNLTSSKDSTTFALLTHVNSSADILEIQSQLHIKVSANYSRFNVTCHNPPHNLTKSVTYLVGKTL